MQKNKQFNEFTLFLGRIADTIYLPFFEYHIMLEQP